MLEVLAGLTPDGFGVEAELPRFVFSMHHFAGNGLLRIGVRRWNAKFSL
ncbi:hypothetical protein [Desulfocurvus vexinensis]|nr:hypothetical protein [Desulfocurvus vexinensis]